jgi:hypothetical protein
MMNEGGLYERGVSLRGDPIRGPAFGEHEGTLFSLGLQDKEIY